MKTAGPLFRGRAAYRGPGWGARSSWRCKTLQASLFGRRVTRLAGFAVALLAAAAVAFGLGGCGGGAL